MKIYKISLGIFIILVISIFFYSSWQIFIPKGTAIGYSILIGSDTDINKENSFYLEENSALGPRVTYGNKKYREIINNQSFDFVLKSDKKLKNATQAYLEIELIKVGSDLFLNDKLIFPGISNYRLLKEFKDSYLYIRKDLNSVNDYAEENPINFVINHYYGSKLYSFRFLDKTYTVVNDYFPKKLSINNTFRGNLNLIIYTEGELDIKFKKKDINSYSGDDQYLLTITSLNGTVVYKKTLEDDGNYKSDSKSYINQTFNITLPSLNGIYYIDFNSLGDNFSDSTIGDITMNTNKVLIAGNFLPITPISLYIRNHFDYNISFYYWHKGKDQKIEIINDNNSVIIDLNESYKGLKYPYTVKPEENNILISKGYLWVFNDLNFAPSKESWFEVPIIIQEKLDNPDFIVIDKNKLKVIKGGVIIKTPIDLEANKDTHFTFRSSRENIMGISRVNLIVT
ncbi:MAG: hypothetical protein Q7S27_07305 [Nanoarchaeota archaeon]|nr:hypothetical protein [Nanoarchaeota archaeon]